jgi:hypothetical protein
MLKRVDTKWRPFIKLTEVDEKTGEPTGGIFYMNLLKVPHIIEYPTYTALIYEERVLVTVKETAKEIFKTFNKLFEEEQDKKAAEAKEYYASIKSGEN